MRVFKNLTYFSVKRQKKDPELKTKKKNEKKMKKKKKKKKNK